MEFSFLKNEKLPLPRTCPDCRREERVRQRNSYKLYPRQCMCDYKIYKNTASHIHHPEGQCPNQFETSYSPDRPEIVYCESCYQQEVV